ncbi:MAG: sulfotransferase [Acidimicrobiia bacterium]
MVWTPAPRPEWVEELNAFGRQIGDPATLVPLDDETLLAAACAVTGLDDFGGEEFREPFGVFVHSLREEADLHLVGRLMARNEVVRSLRNRLEITATHGRHPEMGDEVIDAPVLVTGTGRSGTSILHELLAQDPAPPRPPHVGGTPSVPATRAGDLRVRPSNRGRRPRVRDVLEPRDARVPDHAREWR